MSSPNCHGMSLLVSIVGLSVFVGTHCPSGRRQFSEGERKPIGGSRKGLNGASPSPLESTARPASTEPPRMEFAIECSSEVPCPDDRSLGSSGPEASTMKTAVRQPPAEVRSVMGKFSLALCCHTILQSNTCSGAYFTSLVCSFLSGSHLAPGGRACMPDVIFLERNLSSLQT